MSLINLKPLDTITIDDFNQICRLCPSKTNLEQLYNNPETINMLESCTQLQFDENDGLPNQICQNCTKKLTETFNFINTCKIIDETYRKCLTNPEMKVETIFLEPSIKEEFLDVEIKEEMDETIEYETETGTETVAHQDQYTHDQNTLLDFVRLGVELGCNSLLMRYFTERQGAERLSMHLFMTSFVHTNHPQTYDGFMELCRREMTHELCACASDETLTSRKNPELSLELRYGRITSSKMYGVSCCEAPDEYFIENVVGFYKIHEAKTAKTNELIVQKIEKQLNVKINKRGLILNQDYPEFVAKIDGVTDDAAVVKIKYPKNHKDYWKYLDKEKNLSPKTKTEMHLLMLMTNMRTSYLCVIDPNFANTNTVVKVDFNERYFTEILKKCQVFWMMNIYPVLLKTVSQT